MQIQHVTVTYTANFDKLFKTQACSFGNDYPIAHSKKKITIAEGEIYSH